MREPQQVPYLARPGYRLRRLIELIRLLPFLGLLFVLLPLLWATGRDAEPALTSAGWLYIFATWFILIIAAAVAARALGAARQADDQDNDNKR